MTERYSVLNSYCITSDISYTVNNLDYRFSDPSYASLAYINWVTLLQKYEQLMETSRRISPKMVPNIVFRLYWRKADWFSKVF